MHGPPPASTVPTAVLGKVGESRAVVGGGWGGDADARLLFFVGCFLVCFLGGGGSGVV